MAESQNSNEELMRAWRDAVASIDKNKFAQDARALERKDAIQAIPKPALRRMMEEEKIPVGSRATKADMANALEARGRPIVPGLQPQISPAAPDTAAERGALNDRLAAIQREQDELAAKLAALPPAETAMPTPSLEPPPAPEPAPAVLAPVVPVPVATPTPAEPKIPEAPAPQAEPAAIAPDASGNPEAVIEIEHGILASELAAHPAPPSYEERAEREIIGSELASAPASPQPPETAPEAHLGDIVLGTAVETDARLAEAWEKTVQKIEAAVAMRKAAVETAAKASGHSTVMTRLLGAGRKLGFALVLLAGIGVPSSIQSDRGQGPVSVPASTESVLPAGSTTGLQPVTPETIVPKAAPSPTIQETAAATAGLEVGGAIDTRTHEAQEAMASDLDLKRLMYTFPGQIEITASERNSWDAALELAKNVTADEAEQIMLGDLLDKMIVEHNPGVDFRKLGIGVQLDVSFLNTPETQLKIAQERARFESMDAAAKAKLLSDYQKAKGR